MKVFLRTTIDRADREAVVLRHYDESTPDPTAVGDERMVALTLYLYAPHWVCKDSGWPVVSQEVCAALEGKEDLLASKHYSAKAFLEEYRERVDPTFEWDSYDVNSGKARRARAYDHDEELQHRIQTKGPEDMVDRVYAVDGTAFNRKKQRAERERMYEEAAATRGYAVSRVQQDVLDYMNGHAPDRFTRAYRKYGPAAYAEADRLYRAGDINENAYAAALSALRAVGDQPKAHYACSTRMKSARIFPAHSGLLTLKTEVSAVLRGDWFTYDLTSSQTAINAVRWGAAETTAFLFEHLDDDAALWRRWFAHLDYDYDALKVEADRPSGSGDPARFDLVKKPLKVGNYATQFGMTVRNVVRGLDEKLGDGTGEHMLRDDLFAEMLERREEALTRIEAASGAEDCFGNWIQIEPGQDARSVSAQLAQNEELALLHPAVELAKTDDAFDIVLWQHDGFDVAYKDRREHHVASAERKIIEAVGGECRRRGIPTRLSVA